MRLALKITWIVMALATVGLGIQAKLRLDRELEILDREMRRDQRLLGRALQPMLQDRYADAGAAALDDALAAVAASEQEIELRAVAGDGLPQSLRDALRASGETTTSAFGADDPGALTSYFALEVGSGEDLVLRLSEPLAKRQAFIDASLREFLILLASLLAGVTVVGALAGYWLIGRRVERLVRSARAVSAGDYSIVLDEDGWDEIAMLSREMTASTRRLEAAERKAKEEAERRSQTVHRLRHGDRLATVGMLASRVAHDVGTPLNVIAGRAGMIARREVEGAEIERNAEIVAAQADQIAAKIRDLLSFARSRVKPRQPVDLGTLLSESQSLLESLARLHAVALQTTSRGTLSVTGDALQLQQALVNLIVNAIHAAPSGTSVEVVTERVVMAQTPPHAEPGTFARISVTDRGPGVTDADKISVFEPFFTTKAVGAGTGLGLPIAAEIVRDHGGWIRLRDTEASGTTFDVFIPMEDDRA